MQTESTINRLGSVNRIVATESAPSRSSLPGATCAGGRANHPCVVPSPRPCHDATLTERKESLPPCSRDGAAVITGHRAFSTKPLVERHQPRSLSEVRGHPQIIKILQGFTHLPTSKAFLFAGPTGVGTTCTGRALAQDLRVPVEETLGGFRTIIGADLTATNLKELVNTTMSHSSMLGDWVVILVNEADSMSDRVEKEWLGILDRLPAHCIVVFTTNNIMELSRPFRDRCEVHQFTARVHNEGEPETGAEIAAQQLIDAVWQAELHRSDAPKLQDIDGCVEGGNISYRAVLQRLEQKIRLEQIPE